MSESVGLDTGPHGRDLTFEPTMKCYSYTRRVYEICLSDPGDLLDLLVVYQLIIPLSVSAC